MESEGQLFPNWPPMAADSHSRRSISRPFLFLEPKPFRPGGFSIWSASGPLIAFPIPHRPQHKSCCAIFFYFLAIQPPWPYFSVGVLRTESPISQHCTGSDSGSCLTARPTEYPYRGLNKKKNWRNGSVLCLRRRPMSMFHAGGSRPQTCEADAKPVSR